MIHVDKLTKYFGPVLAVDGISFDIAQGEIVGILGQNGAGKSTTLRILTGFLPATSGSVQVAGFDVMTQSLEVRRNLGYLPENVPLYPEMRVDEYVLFRAKLKGVPRSVRSSRVDYCLDRCRLREVRRRLLGTLSKGYRQRVGLADAMINDPPILILDEPTSGLDPVQIRETLALIRELGEKRTVLLSTHILSEVEAVCQRIIIIHSGRIGLDQPLAEMESEAETLGRIVVESRGVRGELAAILERVPGVRRVVTLDFRDDPEIAAFEIETHDGADLREALGQALTSKGFPLRRLERTRQKLEEAFFDVLRREDPLVGIKSSN